MPKFFSSKRSVVRLFGLAATAAVAAGVVVLLVRAGEAPGTYTILMLKCTEPELPDGEACRPLLGRELVRQAVLIAARDGLGCATRDATLREPLSPAPTEQAQVLDAQTSGFGEEDTVKLKIESGAAEPAHEVWSGELAAKRSSGYGSEYVELAESAERASRGELVKALKHAGFKGQANKWVADAPARAEAEQRMGEMSEFAQFAAVREAHEAIRAGGESPQRLGVLVRGYANLGQLTRYYFTAHSRAFAARSLLYAQRLVVRDNGSPWSLYHRAYARALAGLQGAALGDVAEAEARVKAGAARPEGAWAKLIDPYCRYATGRLADVAGMDKGAAPLAMLLCFLTVEHCGSRSVAVEMAKAALQVNPDCLFLVDAINHVSGVGYLHRTTVLGLQMFAGELQQRMGQMPSLPPAVNEALKAGGGRVTASAAVATALVQAGAPGADSQEPSWAALGWMVREINFVHVFNRIDFVANQWAVDPTAELAQLRPLVADHPYRGILDYFDAHLPAAQRQQALRDVQVTDTGPSAVRFLHWTGMQGRPSGTSGNMMRHVDLVASQIEEILWWQNTPKWASARAHDGEIIRDVSPESPVGMAALIESDWDGAREHLEQWEREHGDHPALTRALAMKYTELGQSGEAIKWWERYIAKAPDQEAFEQLADLYLKGGDEAKWLATLDRFLQQEDYGLEHAQVQVKVARYFMARGNYAKAQPYAEAAAQTWAEWAMECASECYQGLGDWAKSEEWIRNASERYPGAAWRWWHWCEHTGRGDLHAAAALAWQYLGTIQVDAKANAGALMDLAVYYITEGHPEQAIAVLRQRMANFPGLVSALTRALIAEERGDSATRDEALDSLEKVAANVERDQPGVMQLAHLLGNASRAGGAGKLDLDEVDHCLARLNPKDRPNMNYFVGKFLRVRHDNKAAEKYLRRCAEVPTNNTSGWYHVHMLALYELNAMHVPIPEVREPGIVTLAR